MTSDANPYAEHPVRDLIKGISAFACWVLGGILVIGGFVYIFADLQNAPGPRWLWGMLAVLLGIAFCVVGVRLVSRAPDAPQAKLSDDPEHASALDELIAEFRDKTAVDCVELQISTTEFGLLDSHIGGNPYLPPGIPYPTVRTGEYAGRPLRLLAQINMADIPPLEGFPGKGLLQFYINDAEDDMFGANFDEPTDDNAFRVLYHANTSSDSMPAPHLPDTGWTPIESSCALVATPRRQPMSAGDFRFSPTLTPMYEEAFGTNEWDEDDQDRLEEEFSGTGHRVGGYPFFTQHDPREEQPELAGHTTLLLQLDTDVVEGDNGTSHQAIMWGDAGVGIFLIEPQRLARLDFSNVAFTWDCS